MVASSIRLLKRWLAYGLIEAIPEMAASDQDSQADAEQHVTDNRAGDGRLDYIHQTMAHLFRSRVWARIQKERFRSILAYRLATCSP